MRKSVISIAAVFAAAGLALTACSSGGGTDDATGGATSGGDGSAAGEATPDTTPVTINFTWWGNDDRADRYNQAIAKFNEAYPYITVQTSWQAFPDYWTARNTEAAGNALPDVMQFDSSYLREYASTNRLLDLQEFIDNGTIDLGNFDESLVAAGNLNDVQAAIPTSTNTLGMFVNPTVIEQVGVDFPADGYTYDEYNEFVQAVSDANVTNAEGYKLYGSGDYTSTFWFFLQWVIQQGEAPFTDDGQLNFTEDDVVEWLSLTADLRENKAVFPVDRGVALSPLGGFTVNEVAAEATWDNFMASYTADSGTDNLEIVPIWSGDNGTQNFFRPSMLLAAGANTEHAEAAATFINFLLTDPSVGEIFGTSKGVPADSEQRAAIVAEEGSTDAKVLAYEELIGETETSTAPIPVKGFGTIEEKWRNLGEELNYGNITPEQFADEWFAEASMAVG
ncbi:MAG TPA: sugar ABC transporter substrate-binding protein [Micrococcales bacterium]|uniref:Extracellular solute-binding protein n=1 Tax=Miniimonas arenae TaxID=676201 RepID=A0A5C5BAU0_9MICO|nr:MULTISPECIES: extracellular solute-binding protein [Miniimonas]TNU73599.1 extracellular solute-binding protein [Miniimonas arenae]HCX84291.1 sugar ABC transporter substrate-binding protein [Micrococcales bacterium]